MKLKTYIGRNLKEALAQVKKELGPEAVILSTQSRRILGPRAVRPCTEVEVRAAVEDRGPAQAESYSRKIYDERFFLLKQVQKELRELKELFARWFMPFGPPAWLSAYNELADLHQSLVRRGVADHVLQKWLANVQELVRGADSYHPVDTADALRLLMESFEVIDLWQPPGRKGPRWWTFIGPAGVGKTTTVAKLAVQLALKMQKKVGLISLDCMPGRTYDLLALYGKLIGAPFIPIPGKQELREALNRLPELDIVLIDTLGQGLTSPDTNLSDWLAELPQPEHHLLLSATWSEGNLAAAIRTGSRFPLESIIITKADECRDFSGLFNQLCRHHLPVSYLTTGPRIPEDMEPASKARILALLWKNYPKIAPCTAGEGYEPAVGA
jgi:flagellar biosynthesis protein FlhF